jgi:hypothetical protein
MTLVADERGADWVWLGRRDALTLVRRPRPILLTGAFTVEAHVGRLADSHLRGIPSLELLNRESVETSL